MIRINLLRKMAGSTAAQAESNPIQFRVGGPSATQKMAAFKFLGLLIFPLIYYIFQTYLISQKNDDIAKVNEITEQVTAETKNLGSAAPEIEKFKIKQKALKGQLEAIKKLGKVRLREVKALDALQTAVPAKVWLKTLKVSDGLVSIQGFSGSNEGVPEFLGALTKSPFFSDIDPKNTTLEQGANGPLKKFEIQFKIGKRDI